jgi:plasmid stabilization system protein ParE
MRNAIESLPDSPRLGRVIPVPDGGPEELRELVVAPYVIRYIVEPQRIVIIRLWHGREDRSEAKDV